MVDLSINLNGLVLKNPVLTASGTAGYGIEMFDFINLNDLGGIIFKSITLHPKEGNSYPRMVETPAGMLNSVGLQNKGLSFFVNEIYPVVKDINTVKIVNIAGSTIEEYIAIAECINDLSNIQAIELNVSCPNVKEGGMVFGVNPELLNKVVSEVRKRYKKHLIVKLSPNVTDITQMAKIAEDAGADIISLINTIVGMAINIYERKPVLSTIIGGLSGPAIKPIALRMVWQVVNSVKIPVIGIGGICTAEDALEFLIVGASAVQVGTANFINPKVTIEIIEGIRRYLENNNFASVKNIIKSLIT
ncbi:MAG: dihydroorotate dehydrogenase [Bacteroidales bacterium]|nr:dihydroorotate dehydrogenase [Bacteroidales bacterium]